MYDNAVAWMIGFANDRADGRDADVRTPRPTNPGEAARHRRPSGIAGFAGRIVDFVRPERPDTAGACCAA